MNRVLAITGAGGFLGRHLVAECIKQNVFSLRLLTRNKDNFKNLSDNSVVICEGDLLKHESLSTLLMSDITLIHLAYINSNEEANIKATENLVETAKRLGVKRVVHCSSSVVVGFSANGLITENTLPEPKGGYQNSKYKIEKILLEHLAPSVELAILRPTEIIGTEGVALKSMIHRISNEGLIKNYLYNLILKERRFNYVAVSNVVSALILLATTTVKQEGEVYIISDDDDEENNYQSVYNILKIYIKGNQLSNSNIGLSRNLLSLIFKLMPTHSPPNRIYSYSKIYNLGYRKTTTLRQAITDLILSILKKNENP